MAITNRARLDSDESGEPSTARLAAGVARSALKGPARFARDRVWEQPGMESLGGIGFNHDWRVHHQWNGDPSAEDDRFSSAGDEDPDERDEEVNYNRALGDTRPLLRGPMLGLGAGPVGPRRRGRGQSSWARLRQQQSGNVISANARDAGDVLGV
jgi:hypothetical protein